MKRDGGNHCAFCGAEFAPEASWPRHCSSCEATTGIGLITLVTVIARQEGKLATCSQHPIHQGEGPHLPAAFLDFGETWRQTAARVLGVSGRFLAASAESDENGIPRLYAALEGDFCGSSSVFRGSAPQALADAFDRRVACDLMKP